jgi:hypothetical protein
VTLERQDNGTANPFKPVFRLLESTGPDAGSDPARVARRDIQQPNNRIDYRNPKCEAILDIDQQFCAVWCDRIEMEDAPETVWAAYGYAGG